MAIPVTNVFKGVPLSVNPQQLSIIQRTTRLINRALQLNTLTRIAPSGGGGGGTASPVNGGPGNAVNVQA